LKTTARFFEPRLNGTIVVATMGQPESPTPTLAHRLLHGWAVLTVVASACAIALGSVVTTFKVGMEDPLWPTAPWHLLVINWTEPSTGYLIEHSHRLAAYLAGFCFTVFALASFFVRTGRDLRWLGVAALAAVIGQGVLGGTRVLFDVQMGKNLALIHGTFAQVVFSLGVAVALFTSPRLMNITAIGANDTRTALRVSLLLTVVAFAQLVWGALLRHTLSPLSQRGHILTAFLVVAVVVWLTKIAFENPDLRRLLRWPVLLLLVLVTVQVLLGVEAYLYRFTAATVPDAVPLTIGQAVLRSLHVLVGSWILAAAVSCTVVVYLSRRVDENKPALADEPLAPTRRPVTSEAALQPAAVLSGSEHLEGRL
jgi:heme A synthase